MDFEGALRARLLADNAITAITGQRVYWDDRPQSDPLPAIVLSVPSDVRPQTLGGFDLPETLVQVDVLGSKFSEKKALKEAVIATLAPGGASNGIIFQRASEISARTLNERTETQFVFRDAIDFLFRWTTA